MRYEKSETLELGKAEDLVLLREVIDGIEQNHGGAEPYTSTPFAAYLSEFDEE